MSGDGLRLDIDNSAMRDMIAAVGATPQQARAAVKRALRRLQKHIMTGSKRAVIPADGQWHEIVFDLNALHLGGAETGAVFGSSAIGSVKSVTLQFSCAEKNAALDVDEFRFSTGASGPNLSVNPIYSLLARLIALLKTVVRRFMRTGEC